MEKKKSEEERPVIEATLNGPYLVKGLKDFRNSRGEPVPVSREMLLCRCGHSSSKPFCDGTHFKIGFSSGKVKTRVPDRMDHYKGKSITIHDNRGVCSHAGFCTDNSPKVFLMGKEPWINPDGDDAGRTAKTIRMCPSGALSHDRPGDSYKDAKRDTRIVISKDGPYNAEGGPVLKDHGDSQPESKEHFTLCRCGGSKNKPFCDGNHWYIKFQDKKN